MEFTVPISINRIALLGGIGDNLIQVDPSVQLGMLLYGGPGHNILMAGSGNDVLVGGSGTSILEGGLAPSDGNNGNDVLYGGNIPAVYQSLINTFGAAATAPPSNGAPTSNALMTWLRQQPAGHNVLIGGSGNSQLYAGNGGDLLIGSSAQFENGQFVLGEADGTQDGGRDVMEGGTGQDLMIGGVGGDAMLAGSGNSVLIGGTGENILEGGAGNDVLVGDSSST